MLKLDRKPRRNVQYRDLANAVDRIDRLEFLQDTVPNTVPFGKIKRDAAIAQAKLRSGGAVGGDAPAGGNGGKGRGGRGGDSAVGGAARIRSGRTSNGPPPTAISALMANGDGATNGSAGSKKRQQMLSFSILNGDDDGEDESRTSLTFRSVPSSGAAAAAAALAQAAAASGVDDGDPDAQLEQDMQRAREDGPSRLSSGPASAHYNGATDTDMLDARE